MTFASIIPLHWGWEAQKSQMHEPYMILIVSRGSDLLQNKFTSAGICHSLLRRGREMITKGGEWDPEWASGSVGSKAKAIIRGMGAAGTDATAGHGVGGYGQQQCVWPKEQFCRTFQFSKLNFKKYHTCCKIQGRIWKENKAVSCSLCHPSELNPIPAAAKYPILKADATQRIPRTKLVHFQGGRLRSSTLRMVTDGNS